MSLTAPAVRTAQILVASTRMGPVRIGVTEPAAALAIWRDVVGLELITQTEALITLGVGGQVLIELEPFARGPVIQRSLGLYHVAIHVPARADLARFVVRAIEAGVRISPTDHLVSEAVYLWDRDGNGIEMTFETPWRGTLGDSEAGTYGVTKDGKPHSGREAIDLDDLLGELSGADDRAARLPAGTRIGHVHLHVRDLDMSMEFYRDLIGFGGLAILRQWGMGDVGLGYMPHALAFNIWAGVNAKQPPAGVAGLRHFTILVPDADEAGRIQGRLNRGGVATEVNRTGFEATDPSGNRFFVRVDDVRQA